jgi:histidinol-phosphate aminotransferase
MNEVEKALGLVRKAVRNMDGYVPGLQPEPGQRLVKLNTNENPHPPSPRVLAALREASEGTVRLYPSPDAALLRERAGALYGITPAQVMCGNGSDEILAMLMRTFISERDAIAYFAPSYSLYPVLARIAQARTVEIPLPRVQKNEDMADIPVPSPKARMFFLTMPNSPYGVSFPTAWVARLLERFDGIVVADEAYVDYAPESSLPLLAASPRLVIVRTLSKAYSLAGMRAGLVFAHESLIREMMKVKDSYNVSGFAQIAACAALEDQEHFRRTRDMVLSTRGRFSARLTERGFRVLPSQANFVFAIPPAGIDAGRLFEALLARGFLVRHWKTPPVSDGLRISIGTDADMDSLARVIEEECSGCQ